MAEKKPKRPEFTTPKAVSSFPKLLTPDTKFAKAGEPGSYSVKLVLTPEQVEAIRANAEPIMAEYIENDLADTAKDPKKKSTLKSKQAAKDAGFQMSVADQMDEDGAETGNKLLTFKQSAEFSYVKDGKERKVKAVIPMFDIKRKPIKTHNSKGDLLPNNIQIWGGTTMKIRYQVIPAFIASSKVYHATLRPIAIQIIDLVSSGTGSRSAGDFGFGEEEGSFVAEESFSDESETTEEAPAGEVEDAAGY